MTEDRDPELVEDEQPDEGEDFEFELPDYDPSEFELPDDYEYEPVEEGDEDGSEA